ncbi:MAG: ERCC4 domain-containing protein [Smithella sp.]
MKIIIDNREQRPVLIGMQNDPRFPGISSINFGTLTTGDYSLEGMSKPSDQYSITIERKSLADFFSSTGKHRDRFEKEMKRMEAFTFAAIVIEADWRTIFRNPPPVSQMDPSKILRTIIAFCQRHTVHCWDCPSRSFAEKMIYLLLKRFHDDRQPGGKMYQP